MDDIEVQRIIKKKKVPADDLDSLLDNLLGNLLPIVMTLMFGYFTFFMEATAKSASKKSTFILFCLSLSWILYGAWKKIVERKLKSITTNLSLKNNLLLIDRIIEGKKMHLAERKDSYYTIHISSWMNRGCRLTLIAQENVIYYNLRFEGSSRGRPPYSLGLVPFQRWSFKRELRKQKNLIINKL